MGTYRAEFRPGTKSYYMAAVEEYCAEKKISPEVIERRPNRQLTSEEMGAIVAVFNNERTVATLQSCVDNIDTIMAKVSQGIAPQNIFIVANPYSPSDKTIGYIAI